MKLSRVGIVVGLVVFLAVPSVSADELGRIRDVYDRGELAEALERVDGYLSMDSQSVDALFLKGVVLADLGRSLQAESVFRQVIDADAGMPEVFNNLAVLLAARGEYQEAIDVLKDALSTHPSYQAAFENLSKVYARLASDAYSRALGVEGNEVASIDLVMLRQADRLAQSTESSADEPTAFASVPAVAEEPELQPVVTAVEPLTEAIAEAPPAEVVTEWQEVEVVAPAAPLDEGTTEVVDVTEATAEAAADEEFQTGELSMAVQAWADAWSAQNVDDYLAAYATGFVPDEGGRGEWEDRRRDRLMKPTYINVSIAFLDAQMEGEDTGRIRFLQGYESDSFNDSVTKTLRMIREDGRWKILEETVEQ